MSSCLNISMRIIFLIKCSALMLLAISSANSAVDRSLPFPEGEPTAESVAKQVYFVNHFYAYSNFSFGAEKSRKKKAILINLSADGHDSTLTLERHLNNDYSDDAIRSRELFIFNSGKLRGTSLLFTDYVDPDKNSSYAVWMPATRKVARFSEPALDGSWGDSVFTFGDMALRKPEHDSHELLGKKKMRGCLGVIASFEGKKTRYAHNLPKRSCRHINKQVYGLKSTTKFPDWWYDYRISMVDTKTYADYRTIYYKDDEIIKIIDKDWIVMDKETESDDPRSLFWEYWYGVDLRTGQQSWTFVPQHIADFNRDVPNSFWTVRTLRLMGR